MKRGDILEASVRDRHAGLHYIIFYSGKDESYFIGGMLTTSSEYMENIPMVENHFETKDIDGRDYKVTYKKSHLVPAKLMKLEAWGPFKIVGKLTIKGIKFVEDIIDNMEPMIWEEYLANKGQN